GGAEPVRPQGSPGGPRSPRASHPARAGPPQRAALHRSAGLDGRPDPARRRRGAGRGRDAESRIVVTGEPSVRRARTVFTGTGPFGVDALRALAAAEPLDPFELVGVV